MSNQKEFRLLVPFLKERRANDILNIALAMSPRGRGRIIALGILEVPGEVSLSYATISARNYREILKRVISENRLDDVEIKPVVRISRKVWQEIINEARKEKPDLILFDWSGKSKRSDKVFGVTIDEVVKNPPCDISIIRHYGRGDIRSILVPIRGGPHARLAAKIAIQISENTGAHIKFIHFLKKDGPPQDKSFSIKRALNEIGAMKIKRNISTEVREVDDVLTSLHEESENYDLLIIGASIPDVDGPYLFGYLPEQIARSAKCSVMVVKTSLQSCPSFEEFSFDFLRDEVEAELLPANRKLSEKVDKWFAENTFHSSEFEDIDLLVDLKKKQNLTISLCLPALNECETIGEIIKVVKSDLFDQHHLLDEILLIDSGSTDGTVQIADDLGIRVYQHSQILPELGTYRGKGEALWKSLFAARGDIIAWIDTDIRNIHPRFVYGIIGPLLHYERIKYVKGFYRRPIKIGNRLYESGGGRVTELTARPLFNLFYPELSGLIQPLSGEYAGRRDVLLSVPFYTGYGVETGLLIDMLKMYGLNVIAQVDLKMRVHRNQHLDDLGKMSFAIMQAVMDRLEKEKNIELLKDINKDMKLIRQGDRSYFLELLSISDSERPPANKILHIFPQR
ncbi:MAG: glucosyl-3-phosphoglycerate synthase [Actinobacteria bacterium]|nr:glucosyl-3-phosphoglycerate synthase [Actinomycetota bacterium]